MSRSARYVLLLTSLFLALIGVGLRIFAPNPYLTSAQSTTPIEISLGTRGSIPIASSEYNSGGFTFPAKNTVTGDRTTWQSGVGGWASSVPVTSSSQWIEIDYLIPQALSEIDVIHLQDNPGSPVTPTLTTTCRTWCATDFLVQTWDSSMMAWVTVSGGAITGNTHVWNQFALSPAITTSKMRIYVTATNGGDGLARIVQFEGWYTHPSGAQTFTASTCSHDDVGGQASKVLDGDIVVSPGSSSSPCTWKYGIATPQGIGVTFIGSGTPTSSISTRVPSMSCESGTTVNFDPHWTDLSSVAGTDILYSATGSFDPGLVGNQFHIISGTHFISDPTYATANFQVIRFIDRNHIQLASDPTTGGDGSSGVGAPLNTSVMFTSATSYGNNTIRLSCITINNQAPTSFGGIAFWFVGTCSQAASDCPDVRVDNVHLTGFNVSHNNSFGMGSVADMFGVLDHDDFDASAGAVNAVEISYANFRGVGAHSDETWAETELYGTKYSLYFENDTFEGGGCCENEGLPGNFGNGGSRAVVRFSDSDNPGLEDRKSVV